MKGFYRKYWRHTTKYWVEYMLRSV